MIVMRSPKTYFRLALTILILFGIVLPFAFGVKDVQAVCLLFYLCVVSLCDSSVCTYFPRETRIENKGGSTKEPNDN